MARSTLSPFFPAVPLSERTLAPEPQGLSLKHVTSLPQWEPQVGDRFIYHASQIEKNWPDLQGTVEAVVGDQIIVSFEVLAGGWTVDASGEYFSFFEKV